MRNQEENHPFTLTHCTLTLYSGRKKYTNVRALFCSLPQLIEDQEEQALAHQEVEEQQLDMQLDVVSQENVRPTLQPVGADAGCRDGEG